MQPRNKRIPYVSPLEFSSGNDSPFISASSTDISDTGIHIRTGIVFAEGSSVVISITTEEETHECEGVVAWAKIVPRGVVDYTKQGMGIKFVKVPQKLIDIYWEKFLQSEM